MTRVTLCSAKGSPGVTTLACLLGAVWPAERAVVVAECDPSGGDLAGRFGLSTRLGMTSLILTERQAAASVSAYEAHVQHLPGGLDVLVAPTGADSAMALDHELGKSSSDIVAGTSDLIADCGRLLPGAIGQERMIRTADNVLLLLRPDVTGIAHAQWAANRIRELSGRAVSALVVAPGDCQPSEVADELDVTVLGTVPLDPRAAKMACGGPGTAKELVRSGLVAFARQIVNALTDGTHISTEPDRTTKERRVTRVRDRTIGHQQPDRWRPDRLRSRPQGVQNNGRPRATSP
jgi:MinD-like ATPase involved in chromosome partitioning or flagellar assembly